MKKIKVLIFGQEASFFKDHIKVRQAHRMDLMFRKITSKISKAPITNINHHLISHQSQLKLKLTNFLQQTFFGQFKHQFWLFVDLQKPGSVRILQNNTQAHSFCKQCQNHIEQAYNQKSKEQEELGIVLTHS